MAKCRLCGKSGWFLRTQPNGVCARCDSVVRDEISSLKRILGGCQGREAKNPDVALRECNAVNAMLLLSSLPAYCAMRDSAFSPLHASPQYL
jgi:hypothetical protein